MAASKAAHIFSPHKLNFMQPNVAAVDDLATFLNTQEILDDLNAKLPLYLHISILQWMHWPTHLPKWSSVLQKVLLIQPSSAASGRAFSIQQESMLQDPWRRQSRSNVTSTEYVASLIALGGTRTNDCPGWDSNQRLPWVGLEPMTLCFLDRVLFLLSYQGSSAGRALSLQYNTTHDKVKPQYSVLWHR